ncbi:MAG: 30S ribosomal protein S17 [Solirubrobacterales bacterium]
MSDETKKDDATDETPQGEAAEAAGPVAAGDPPPPAVAKASSGEVPPTAPPADEADGADAKDAAAEESAPAVEAEQKKPAAAEAEPAAEAKKEKPATEEAEPNPEDELPWKEKLRLQRSRRPHKAGPALTVEERATKRGEGRKRKAESRRKERAAAKAGKTAGTGTPVAEKDAVAAKMRQGIVVSNKGEKSITVRIDIARRHPTYEKVVRRSRTLHAHDERNEAGEGDIVRVIETRPLSKTKRWRLVEVLEKAK